MKSGQLHRPATTANAFPPHSLKDVAAALIGRVLQKEYVRGILFIGYA
jgi:hypothetical protein